MTSFIPNIWNTLTPLQRASVLAGKPQTEADILSSEFDLSAIKELIGCGCVADRYLDATRTVH
jgi:hypothetical protein